MTSDFLKGIGLNRDQIALITAELEKESEYRRILASEHVGHIELVVRATNMNEVDLSNEPLLREKIRAEYSDLIPTYFKKVSKVTL